MNPRYAKDNPEFFYKILDLGIMECDKYRMVMCDDHTERLQIPVMALLIHHPDLGNVVYDTGNAVNWQEELYEDTKQNFPIIAFRSLEEALKEEGLTPEDIDLVIMSHLHFDHAGSLRIFAGTKAGSHVMVGKKEYRRAVTFAESPMITAYVGCHYLADGLEYELISEDTTLADGFRIFLQMSHSPALLGLQLDIPGQCPLLVVSDAVYTRENYDTEIPSGSPNKANAEGFAENLAMLKRMQREQSAEILFGHDLEQMREFMHRHSEN